MIFDIIKKNKTLQELLAGIILFGIVGEIVVLFFRNRVYNSLGFIIGIVISLICAAHMAWSVEVAVSLDEKSAIAYSRKYTVIRYIIMCAVLVIIGITDMASPVTLIIGYMGLKFGAYLNPFIHKLMNKASGGEENK